MTDGDCPITVFADSRPALAFLVQNRLAEAGIESFIENESLRQASGDLPPGWATAPRVVVAEADAHRAREVVAEFKAEATEPPAIVAAPQPLQPVVLPPTPPGFDRPACPECSRPRMTECPYCHSASADFPAGDRAGGDDAGPPLLICPTCDEPFAPDYLRRCEWCGHDFGTGVEPVPQRVAEYLSDRVTVALMGLAIAIVGIFAYFSTLLR